LEKKKDFGTSLSKRLTEPQKGFPGSGHKGEKCGVETREEGKK